MNLDEIIKEIEDSIENMRSPEVTWPEVLVLLKELRDRQNEED